MAILIYSMNISHEQHPHLCALVGIIVKEMSPSSEGVWVHVCTHT